MKHLIDTEIEINGQNWIVLNVGLVNGDRVFLHLRSTTQFRQAKNGKHWSQIADWFPVSLFA